MKEEKNYFSSNLKFLRQKQGMEQIDLAKRLGRKSSSSVSEWEKGKYTPKAGVLNDIASIFNVSLSKLMTTDLSNPETEDSINGYTSSDLRKMAENAKTFDGKPLDEEDISAIQNLIEIYLRGR